MKYNCKKCKDTGHINKKMGFMTFKVTCPKCNREES